MTQITILAV